MSTSRAVSTKSTGGSHKTSESKIGALITKFTYAAIKDIKDNWNGDDLYPAATYQHYENVILEKTAQKKTTNVFTVSSEMKQMLYALLFKITEEINNVELAADDNLDTMVTKTVDASDDHYFKYMFDLIKLYEGRFGATLKKFEDQEGYVKARIVGICAKHKALDLQLSFINQLYNKFLKCIAFMASRQVWYCKLALNQNYFLSLLSLTGMEQIMIDEIQSKVRPAAKKASPKKKTDTTVVSTAETTNNTNTAETNDSVTSAEAEEGEEGEEVAEEPELVDEDDVAEAINGI